MRCFSGLPPAGGTLTSRSLILQRYNDRESSSSGESYYEKMAREANAELKFDREKEIALVERKTGKAQKFVMEDFQVSAASPALLLRR